VASASLLRLHFGRNREQDRSLENDGKVDHLLTGRASTCFHRHALSGSNTGEGRGYSSIALATIPTNEPVSSS